MGPFAMGLPALKLVETAADATLLLHPLRQRLLGALREPDSAAGVARRLGLARQKVNYHLRELEDAGLVEAVEERQKRGCVERVVRASATAYCIDPGALGALGEGDPEQVRDRFSSTYLIALAARAIREVATLRRRAKDAKKKLPTFSLHADVRFTSQESLHAFSEELSNEVARLIAKHHDESAPGGRVFRFLLGAYPAVTKTEDEARAEAGAAND